MKSAICLLSQVVLQQTGPPYKGIIWSQKSKKPVGFFCGQRYYWTKVLRIGLLAGFSALIFRNQNPAYTIKKRKGKLSSIGGIPNSESEWIHLLAELHCCTVRSTWQLLHRRVSVVWTAQRSLCLYSLLRDVIAAAANPAGWIRLPVRPWHRQLSEMTSRPADFDNRASSDASETKGLGIQAAAMRCRSNLFVLCRQIFLTSINAVSAAAVSVAVSSRLASGCLGLGFAFCRLSGLFTFT